MIIHLRTTFRYQHRTWDPCLLTWAQSHPPSPETLAILTWTVGCLFWGLIQQNQISLVLVFLLSLFIFSVLFLACPLRSQHSACPKGIRTQRKRLYYLSHSLHKQSSLNIQHYIKRQVPLKITTSLWSDFYYDISSQTQTNSLSERQAAVV